MRRVIAALLLLTACLAPRPARAAAVSCEEALHAEAGIAVERAIKAGLRNGWTDFLDSANDPEPRADFAAYLAKALGWKPDAAWNERNPFVDVTIDWQAGPVAMLYAAGIIRGHGNGLFGPYQPLRAEDTRVIAARTLRLAPDPTPDTAAELLRKAGVDPDFTCGSELVTAAQSWVLVDRMLSVAIQRRRIDPALLPPVPSVKEGLVTCHTINGHDVMANYQRLRGSHLFVGKGPPPEAEAFDGRMPRAEFATILARSLGWEEAAREYSGPDPFSDTADHWARGFIALLRQAGILDGQQGAPFHPNDPLSVAEAKLWLARALRAAPDVTAANADGALKQLGIDPHVTCQGDAQLMMYAQGWILLDRVDSVTWYARWLKPQSQ